MNTEDILLLEKLPTDTLYEILYKLPIETLDKVCEVSKKFYKICQDINFWARKAEVDFGYPIYVFKNHSLEFVNPREEYMKFEHYYVDPKLDSFTDQNRDILLSVMKNRGYPPIIFILSQATETGQLKLIKDLIEFATITKPKSLVNVLNGSLEHAIEWWYYQRNMSKDLQLEIVNLFLDSGANDLNFFLYRAATADNVPVAKLLIEKGATKLEKALTEAKLHESGKMIVYLQNLIDAQSTE